MPLSAIPHSPDTSWEACIALLDRLPALSTEERIEALGTLIRNPSPGIRSRALRMGAALLNDAHILSYLRSEADDVLRNAGLEMLKMRGNKGFHLAVSLLKDADDDLVLQAVLVLTSLRDPRALEALRGMLHHHDPNVVQEVIVAIGELGDARAIPDLIAFLEADPWVQMAAVEALGNLRSPAGVPHLVPLLTDLTTGELAAEALARIGGRDAAHALVDHWLRFSSTLDPEPILGLIAHVLEGLPQPLDAPSALIPALKAQLADERPDVSVAAARALLVLGPEASDEEPLAKVSDDHTEHAVLPACLNHRKDLIGTLIAGPGRQRTWGFLLAARYPEATPIDALASTLDRSPARDQLGPLVRALEKVRDPDLAPALAGFYLRLSEEQRPQLHPLLKLYRQPLLEQIEKLEMEAASRVTLHALLGSPAEDIRRELDQLDDDERAHALTELVDEEKLLRPLPWAEWLDQKPDTYAEVAAAFASRAGLRELLPLFRSLVSDRPEPFLIRVLGDLGDRESVGKLVVHLEPPGNPLEPIVLESLGRIGGPEARKTLAGATASTAEAGASAAGTAQSLRARLAFRALARCAAEEDDRIFRAAIGHTDWYIRLSCAEVLGRFSRPENLAALAQLASDPVPIVAQRALAFLES